MPTNKQYIQDLYSLNKQALLLEEMEHYASLHSVPIIERDGVELLKQLIRLHKPNQILEIGTAIGYSAIQMASANCETQITSIEIDEERFHIASKNVEKVDMTDRIHLILEDANQYLNQLKDEQFDFVFVDAAKGQYQSYIEKVIPFLKTGSLIVIDNVLFKGYVSKEVQDDRKRLMKLGEKIDRFNQWLIKHPELDTTVVETGDGVAIALKR